MRRKGLDEECESGVWRLGRQKSRPGADGLLCGGMMLGAGHKGDTVERARGGFIPATCRLVKAVTRHRSPKVGACADDAAVLSARGRAAEAAGPTLGGTGCAGPSAMNNRRPTVPHWGTAPQRFMAAKSGQNNSALISRNP